MNIPILQDLVIVLSFAFGFGLLFKRFNLPSIVAFILAGVFAGPGVLNLVSNIEEIKLLAEIGIILLLFAIGLEFSLERLAKAKKFIFVAGSLQILLTIGIVYLSSFWLGLTWQSSIFIGFLIAISSTAVVLKILEQEKHIETAFGKRLVGILVFQDLAVIPMILSIPLLSGENKDFVQAITQLSITIIYFLGAIFVFRWLANKIFPIVIKQADSELLMIGFALLCFTLPMISGLLNISLALGAFLAGLIVSETKFKHKVFDSIQELKGVFGCIFFVSLGLLIDLSFVWQNTFVVIMGILAVFTINLIATTIAIASVHSIGKAFVSAVSLIQIGEFAFVLSKIGLSKGIIDSSQYDLFLAVAIISMLLTPYLYKISVFLEKRFSQTSSIV